jgi:hypothetical protein
MKERSKGTQMQVGLLWVFKKLLALIQMKVVIYFSQTEPLTFF